MKPNDVSQIKLRLKKMGKPGKAIAETPNEDPAMAESLDLVSLDSLLLAKRLVLELGGMQQAQKALGALAELLD